MACSITLKGLLQLKPFVKLLSQSIERLAIQIKRVVQNAVIGELYAEM